MSISRKLKNASSGAADGGGGGGTYVDDVFSTYLYEGTGAAQTITNGIDLAGEGGLVWLKRRDNSVDNVLIDNERGVSNILFSNLTNAENGPTTWSTSFNSDGFNFTTASGYVNASGGDYASWTFRKAPKFFDVVHATITGTTATIPHNLGSTPGCIIRKRVDDTQNWFVWHRGLSAGHLLYLDLTIAEDSSPGINTVTDTSFKFSGAAGEYVFYIFAHNDGDGEFGEDGDQDIIKCGSYTGNGSEDGPTVNLGWEPQWLMIRGTGGGDWQILDNMRGIYSGGTEDARLFANKPASENHYLEAVQLQATGFKIDGTTGGAFNTSGADFIYIAIRRPNKPAEEFAATDLFGIRSYTETSDYQQLTTGNLVDWGWQYLNGDGYKFFTRLLGQGYLNPTSTAANNTSPATEWDYMDGFEPHYANGVGGFNPRIIAGFKRSPGFFDVVTYEGDGQAGREIPHNLGVVPELVIHKHRDKDLRWSVWHHEVDSPSRGWWEFGGVLNENYAFGDTNVQQHAPTSSTWPVDSGWTNSSSDHVLYLFATVPGISKVGSYTGTGNSQDIDCGFTNGARFVLIKRTDSTGDWYVWDTERGITAGNDPYLLLNTTDAEVTNTDYIDPLSSGFTVTASAPDAINAVNGEYIFYAIA